MDRTADVLAAFAALGLERPTTDAARVRRAYAAALRRVHPDLHPDPATQPEATARTAELTVAYRLVVAALAADWRPPVAEAPGATAGTTGTTDDPPDDPAGGAAAGGPAGMAAAGVRLLDDDTIEVEAPLDLTFAWLVQASHDIGDVTLLDRSAALLQLVVQFVDEPVCQMIFDLQGRAARGTTEVFCTIDSIEDRPAPDIAVVTRFVAEQLATTIDTWD